MNLVQVNIKSGGYLKKDLILNDISFAVKSGELVGLIGPNGAGKSTILKTVMGQLPYMDGKIDFPNAHTHYAYIPEQPVLYDNLTLWEHLEFAAAVGKMSRETFVSRAEELLKLFRLYKEKHRLPVTFSKGMQQKVMLILGFMMRPALYIVDEPFIGLDPHGMRDFLQLVDQVRQDGAGILMSTHSLDTAEKICTSFILIHEGTIISQGNLEAIRQQSRLPEGSLFDCFISLLEMQS
ncbi:ABC transporter ATP-binding protein [Desulfitobacterium hafniense]|uniref:ABC transporter ATP-binding protein n=1 Tax=Desulfitobacterium hafniense TaxID=49338 RepID=A0A0W1JJB2_DESHA|nr:ABC transporter ATP-binding protein [Desulfitobacterium hafniense]KTE91438.1 ABC transporter ATP-binding protein [Desulfitobacterium hafniense]